MHYLDNLWVRSRADNDLPSDICVRSHRILCHVMSTSHQRIRPASTSGSHDRRYASSVQSPGFSVFLVFMNYWAFFIASISSSILSSSELSESEMSARSRTLAFSGSAPQCEPHVIHLGGRRSLWIQVVVNPHARQVARLVWFSCVFIVFLRLPGEPQRRQSGQEPVLVFQVA